jgi:hypothetical protein
LAPAPDDPALLMFHLILHFLMFLILRFLMFLDPALPLDPKFQHFLMFHLDHLIQVPFTPLDPEVPIEIVFKKEIFVVFNIIGFGVFK